MPYFIPPRIDPTIPPTTPASVRCSLPLGRYSISACASLEIGRDCNQTRPGAGKRGQEDAVAAKDHIADSGNARDLEAHAGLERAYMAGMHSQGLAVAKVLGDHLARELDPRSEEHTSELQSLR